MSERHREEDAGAACEFDGLLSPGSRQKERQRNRDGANCDRGTECLPYSPGTGISSRILTTSENTTSANIKSRVVRSGLVATPTCVATARSPTCWASIFPDDL